MMVSLRILPPTSTDLTSALDFCRFDLRRPGLDIVFRSNSVDLTYTDLIFGFWIVGAC